MEDGILHTYSFNHRDVMACKATKFGEMKQNKGYYDRSRSFKVTDVDTNRKTVGATAY